MADGKRCTSCGKGSPEAFFWKCSRSPDGLHFQCKSCMEQKRKDRARGFAQRMPASCLRALRHCGKCDLWKRTGDFYSHVKEGHQGWCMDCVKAVRKEYYKANKEESLRRERVTRRNFRLEAIAAYGGKCECCGESHPEFLTIDHIGGGGNEHRRKAGGTKAVYRQPQRQGYPRDGYRLLCYNCNCSIGAVGYCPHQQPSLMVS